MTLPNFLIIGAARCGTTSLYQCMKEHPDIFLPENKRPEPHFFLKADQYARGLQFYEKQYFSKYDGEKAIGEASTSYIYQDYVPKRIFKCLPHVKLIAILRNPIERAVSNYRVTANNGLDALSFEEAIACEENRIANPASDKWKEIQPHAYVSRGFYYRQIKNYLAYFKRENMLLLLFDDLVTSPETVFRQVFRFLRVDETFTPASTGRICNASASDQSPIGAKVLNVLRDRFAEENKKLSKLINRDLSQWDGLTYDCCD